MSFASHARWCDYEPLQAINNGVSYGYSSPLEMAETEGLRGVFASPLTAVEFFFSAHLWLFGEHLDLDGRGTSTQKRWSFWC